MATIQESVEQRKVTARGLNADNMALPPTYRSRPHDTGRHGGGEENEQGLDSKLTSLAGGPGIAFCMLKRGNKGKVETREVS